MRTLPNFLLLLLLTTLVHAQDAPRPTNPLAPSLPLLTEAEEQRIEKIIDRFIAFDIGQLKGPAGKKALEDFNNLGPEAFLQLIEGINKAAEMGSSCPAVLIGRKLGRLIDSTRDMQLLDLARENIGAGVVAKRHLGTIQDLKLGCSLRKSYLVRNGLVVKYQVVQAPPAVSTKELALAASSERGPKLKKVLAELEKRSGEIAVKALADAAASEDSAIRELGFLMLEKNLARLTPAEMKKQFGHERTEVRLAAARAAGAKKAPLAAELIALLDDTDAQVQQAARQALVAVSRGEDFGPSPSSTPTDRAEAIRQWRAWLQKSTNRPR